MFYFYVQTTTKMVVLICSVFPEDVKFRTSIDLTCKVKILNQFMFFSKSRRACMLDLFVNTRH